MAAAFGERQRAEQFARLLDGLDSSRDGAGVATLIPPQKADPEIALMLRVVESVIEEGRFRGPAVRREFKEEHTSELQRLAHLVFHPLLASSGEGSGSRAGGGRPALP